VIEAADHGEQRALATARRPDKSDERRGFDDEIRALDGGYFDVAGTVGLCQTFGDDKTHGCSLRFGGHAARSRVRR
jgi:hypothetical protein